MLLDTHKISLIYDFWKLNNEENYLHDVSELSRKLTDSDTIDAEHIRGWIPDLVRLVELWERKSFSELDEFYAKLLVDRSLSDKVDALLRFLYDIQSYTMVKYLLEKNVLHYKKEKFVSAAMTGFHESCIYGFSQVCMLYMENGQDPNEAFSLVYEHVNTNKKESIRNLTGLQLVCLWAKYFPKRLFSYAHTVRILLNHGARVNMTSTELTTSLHWTCRAKHTTPLAQDLIASQACINARDQLNIQPIHYACWSRNRTLVELLLSKGARLTDQDDLGRTPVHFLCMPMYIETIHADDQQQQSELMQCLLANHQKTAHSIDLSQQDSQGHTLLTYACVSQNLSLMKLLLEHQPDLLNRSTANGRSPLLIAIDEGFLTGVEYLLTRRDLDRQTPDLAGNTAVHHACMCANRALRSDLLQLLIDDQNGVFDFEKRNAQLIDPFMLCTIDQSLDLCRQLKDHNVLLTKKDLHARQSLHLACQLGNYELVSLLLESSQLNINAVDDANRNCLFYAITSGNDKLVDLLIEHGVNIKARDIVGDTPLHLAVQHQTHAYELTRRLLKTQAGKDLLNEPAADGMKPVLLAASHGQDTVIYLLMKNGADMKAVDNEQHTALHLACRSGCMQSAFYLLEFAGLNVNELDCYRQTPIFYAFESNDYDLAQYLISCGAKLDLRDSQNYLPIHIGVLLSNNKASYNLKLIDLYSDQHAALLDDGNNECAMTPFILASMQGNLDIVKHLVLNCKVDIMSKCSNGHTALHYACLMKNSKSRELIEFLMEHGCTYEKVDEPKGSFLYTIVQHGDRDAVVFFIDHWLKSSSDINELHYGATLLDLLYERAQLHHHDIDTEHLRRLLERGARLHSAKLPVFPCPLINDCPQFYLILLQYNCCSIVDRALFICQLLHSVSIHSDDALLVNGSKEEFISVCNYFLRVVQLAHYFYPMQEFFSTIDRVFLPALQSEQTSEQVQPLRKQLDHLRSTPLKLSELARKRIHLTIKVPTQNKVEQLDLTPHLGEFLLQSSF